MPEGALDGVRVRLLLGCSFEGLRTGYAPLCVRQGGAWGRRGVGWGMTPRLESLGYVGVAEAAWGEDGAPHPLPNPLPPEGEGIKTVVMDEASGGG